MAESEIMGMPTVTKRMKCIVIVDHLCWTQIDKLTEPTACSLLDGTVELALAKVFPSQKACHSIPVQDGYVVVQPTYVWVNASQYPLPVPIDGGDVATLAEALVQRIQWTKDRIIIPPMTRHPNPEAATGGRVQHQMEVLQLSVSKRRLNSSSSSSSRSAKLRSRSVDNNQRRSLGKLCLSSSCNLRIINRRNSSLSSSRSVNNSRRSPGKLRLSSSCNIRISNRRNNRLCSSRRRSACNLPLSSRCNKYNSLCNRRTPCNLHCRRGTRPGNICLKMRFLIVLMGQNRTDQNTSLVHLCCQKLM
jgi:hypothetical protein